ncbi:MAG TPA: hypothetical protein VGR69_09105 [Candidatus Rubrimentiphilum sp.]|nr:hypothetical protein [Candidatus Rubrimentiphilum sp.]
MSLLLAVLLTTGSAQVPARPDQPLPFCTLLTEHLGPAILTEGDGNDAIARIFPALRDYRNDYKDLNVDRAYMDVYRLKKIYAQLETDQAKLQVALTAPQATASEPDSRELFTQMQIAVNSVSAGQQGVQKALKAFIDDEASAADATNGRVLLAGQTAANTREGMLDARRHIQDVGSHLEMAAAGAMSVGVLNDVAYARPIVANSQHILDQELYLHQLVNVAVERCYARRQAPLPIPPRH